MSSYPYESDRPYESATVLYESDATSAQEPGGGILGCGTWRAYVADGADLDRRWELDYNDLSCGRVIDGASRSQVNMACQIEGLPSPLRWGHELHLYRQDTYLGWAGPVTNTTHTRSGMSIDAQDFYAWMSRRLLENAFDVTDDLAFLFEYVVDQAELRDPIGIAPVPLASGVVGRRTNSAAGIRRADDLLNELARTAVDFTFIGRTLYIGGTEIPGQNRTIILDNTAFRDPQAISDGDRTASEVKIVGSNQSLVATSGGIADYGLVQIVETENTIKDITSLQAAADGRVELLSGNFIRLKGVLEPTAPVGFEELIPGYIFDIRLDLIGLSIEQEMRLTGVGVVAGGGTETVSVEFEPVGAV